MAPMLTRSLLPAAALVASLVLAGCGSDDGETATEPSPSPTSASAATSSAAPATSTPATPLSTTGPACTYTPDGSDPDVELPPPHAQQAGEVPATISLTSGDLPLRLHAGKAPCTVNSFAFLAGKGYFDGTRCHRLTTAGIFVLQCGDPTGTGRGTPGYSFGDELTGTETYPAGTLAMANAGPNTNGSQFFIVYADSQLPPSYTVFGRVAKPGIEAVKAIAAAGTDNGSTDGSPKQPVEIKDIKVG